MADSVLLLMLQVEVRTLQITDVAWVLEQVATDLEYVVEVVGVAADLDPLAFDLYRKDMEQEAVVVVEAIDPLVVVVGHLVVVLDLVLAVVVVVAGTLPFFVAASETHKFSYQQLDPV